MKCLIGFAAVGLLALTACQQGKFESKSIDPDSASQLQNGQNRSTDIIVSPEGQGETVEDPQSADATPGDPQDPNNVSDDTIVDTGESNPETGNGADQPIAETGEESDNKDSKGDDPSTKDPDTVVDIGEEQPESGKGGNGPSDPGDQPTGQEQKQCAKKLGIDAKGIHLSKSLQQQTLEIGDSFAAKITGNQNTLTLNVNSNSENASISGICVFITGNMNRLVINSSVTIDSIYIKARGNQVKADMSISEGAAIGSILLDDRGNQPQITLSGPGNYPCPEAKHRADVQCN